MIYNARINALNKQEYVHLKVFVNVNQLQLMKIAQFMLINYF